MDLRPSKENLRRLVAGSTMLAIGAGVVAADKASDNSHPVKDRAPVVETKAPQTTSGPVKSTETTSTTVSAPTTTSEATPTLPPTTQDTAPVTESTSTTNPGEFKYNSDDPNNYGGPNVPDQGPVTNSHDAVPTNGPLG